MNKMSTNRIRGILNPKWRKKIEINFKRVVVLTLVFTNMFFVAYFFAKWFQWV